MIFPIQPPLTERDDKAATVIIAVVYDNPERTRARARAASQSYIELTFFLFLLSHSRFYFPSSARLHPPSPSARSPRGIATSENIFVAGRGIVPGAAARCDVPVTRNDLLTTAA